MAEQTTKKIRVRVIANGQTILVNQVVELAVAVTVDNPLLQEPSTVLRVEVEPAGAEP
jgi:hypothetical protein